jgi:hypothetical protein
LKAEFPVAFFAGPNAAIDSGHRIIIFRLAAAVTSILLLQMGPADPAIHPAWGNQFIDES